MATLGRSLFWKSEIIQDWNLLLLPLTKSKAGSLSYASFFQLPNTPELNHSLGTDSEGTVSPTESPLLPRPQAPMLTVLGGCGHRRLRAAMPCCCQLHRACAEQVTFCTEEGGTTLRQRDVEVQGLGKARMLVGCLRWSSSRSNVSPSQPEGNLKLLKLFYHFLHCSIVFSRLGNPSGKREVNINTSCGNCQQRPAPRHLQARELPRREHEGLESPSAINRRVTAYGISGATVGTLLFEENCRVNLTARSQRLFTQTSAVKTKLRPAWWAPHRLLGGVSSMVTGHGDMSQYRSKEKCD